MEGTQRARRESLGNYSTWMNDNFMKHVVDSICALNPTHAAILGDIFSYQRLSDHEFNYRYDRFNWIFSCLISNGISIINVTGNHDLGYGSDLTEDNLRRFERYFGSVNSVFEIEGHSFVNLNGLNLDPATNEVLRRETWSHIESFDNHPYPIVLLTHIPLAKSNSSCVDQYSTQFDSEGKVISQNYLSDHSSDYILDRIRPRFVFTGHDHEGCRHEHRNEVKEFTMRSMMGDYGGFVGLFEVEPLRAASSLSYRYHLGGCSFVRLQVLTVLQVAWLVWFVLLGAVFLFL
jgi:UDP-2,3-diacylglucosamine pyrophosphatase LpxH